MSTIQSRPVGEATSFAPVPYQVRTWTTYKEMLSKDDHGDIQAIISFIGSSRSGTSLERAERTKSGLARSARPGVKIQHWSVGEVTKVKYNI